MSADKPLSAEEWADKLKRMGNLFEYQRHDAADLFAQAMAQARQEAREEAHARIGYLETLLRRVLFSFPMRQEPEEQLLDAIRRALAGEPTASAPTRADTFARALDSIQGELTKAGVWRVDCDCGKRFAAIWEILDLARAERKRVAPKAPPDPSPEKPSTERLRETARKWDKAEGGDCSMVAAIESPEKPSKP